MAQRTIALYEKVLSENKVSDNSPQRTQRDAEN